MLLGPGSRRADLCLLGGSVATNCRRSFKAYVELQSKESPQHIVKGGLFMPRAFQYLGPQQQNTTRAPIGKWFGMTRKIVLDNTAGDQIAGRA